ncbi:MAG: immunoglobulin domain-containing protein [Planctomycetes bacterium]|nr:immunoglobulin domain-containing protein [Planctomycetota bacterium]
MTQFRAHRGRFGAAVLASISGLAAARAQDSFWNWETPHVSPITLTPDGALLLAVNTADNRLEIFDASGPAPVWVRSVPVGLDPVSVRARTDNEAWVVNHLSDSISIVDLASGRVVRTLLVGDEPTDVVFAGAPRRAFVSQSQQNTVRVYDPANLAAAPTVLAIQGEEPRALAVSPDGARVYAAIFESGNASAAIRQQDVSNTTGPYGGRNPPPNAGAQFDPPIAAGLAPPPPVAQIVKRRADGSWRDDNNRDWSAFVTWNMHDHDVAIIDAASLSVSYAGGITTNVMGIAVRPDGLVTVVGTESRNEVRFESNLRGVFVMCEIGSFNPATPSTVQAADLNPHLDYASPTIPAPQRALSLGDPRGIAWHPTSGRAYVTGMGSNNVVVTDASGVRYATINVGEGPTGLAMNASGSRLYVMNKFAGSISVVDTSTNSETQRVSFYDPTPSAIREGRPLLYDTHATSGLGQASCASCHLDARSDFLAWDLGNPAGEMKAVNQECRQGQTCRPWHPMKGPMVTQSLQGIVGNGAMHWRGDRENIAAFAGTYVNLQAADEQPAPAQMQKLENFIASVKYGPNPNLNIDGNMPAAINTSGGGPGNPGNGLTLYSTLPVLGGNTSCVQCHAMPTGTSNQIDDPRLPLAPQGMKQSQLRGLWEKVGWLRNGQNNAKGFGFNHHSEFDTLNALLLAGFNFGAPNLAPQRRRDVEAFLLCFPGDTHPGVGAQVTFTGPNNNDAGSQARLATFTALADSGVVGLIAKGRVGGIDRGYVYTGSGEMSSDRSGQFTTAAALRVGAGPGEEITFTVVPSGTQHRMGVDRDSDGFADRDELDSGSNPADPASTPVSICRPQIVDQPADAFALSGDPVALTVTNSGTAPFTYRWSRDGQELLNGGAVSGADGPTLTINPADVTDWGRYSVRVSNLCGDSTSAAATLIVTPPCGADFNTDGGVDGADVGLFFAAWEAANPGADLTADGGVDGADVTLFFALWENGGC